MDSNSSHTPFENVTHSLECNKILKEVSPQKNRTNPKDADGRNTLRVLLSMKKRSHPTINRSISKSDSNQQKNLIRSKIRESRKREGGSKKVIPKFCAKLTKRAKKIQRTILKHTSFQSSV